MVDGFDFHELTQLSADLGDVPDTIGPFLNKAFAFTSRNVKDAANRTIRSNGPSRRWVGLTQAIDYEVTAFHGFGVSTIQSEIGYNDERYGDRAKLGNLREFGAPGADGVPLAPHNDLVNALHANEADFEEGIALAIGDAMKTVNL